MAILHIIPLLQMFILSGCCIDAVIITGKFNTTTTMDITDTSLTSAFPTNINKLSWNEINNREATYTTSHYDARTVEHLLSTSRVEKGRVEERHIEVARTLASSPFHNFFSNSLVDSKNCKRMQTCQDSNGLYETFPKQSCYCDLVCNILDDCCFNFNPVVELPFKKQQFSCILLNGHGLTNEYGIYMITSCLDDWKHEDIRSLCENPGNNIVLKTPVTDKSMYRVTYRNMYCAQCNLVYDFEYWRTNVRCYNNKANITDCNLKHETSNNTSIRICQTNLKSNCSTAADHSLLHNCTNGPFSVVYTHGKAYRNIDCAYCDGYNKDELFCSKIKSSIPTAQPALYSFRLLVDLNIGVRAKVCKENEIYDAFSKICRQIYCALPSIPINGACIDRSTDDTYQVNKNSSVNNNCTLVKVKSNEFETLNDSKILLLSSQAVLKDAEFLSIGMDIYVCRDLIASFNSNSRDEYWFIDSSNLGIYLSATGLIISIIFLAITLLVYICIPQLLNIHGKNLVCLVATLLLSHILFLLSPQAVSFPRLCKSAAILLHFLYISSFSWMNVIAFDFCTTFSRKFQLVERNRNDRRFILYCIYGWCTPLVIVLVSISFDFAELSTKLSSFKPAYGKGICWITSRDALLIFAAIPFCLFKLFDFVAFTMTMVFITRARRQGARTSKKNDTCTCIINLKLSVIMGITWVFAFIANISKSLAVWYMYIAFNSLQGMFIAVCFVCSKTVFRKVKAKFRSASAHYTSSVT